MKDLGIAKGTIYHYFESKEALLEAVVLDIVNTCLNEIEIKFKSVKGNA